MHLRTLLFLLAAALSAPAWPAAASPKHLKPQVGKASIYAKKFAGRKMADGARMDPAESNAASKTLPLGTRARVTNLANGRSAMVTIEDRGPYVPGRIVDLSPHTANEIGLTQKQGVAQVEVVPIELPGESRMAGD
jgi:rare lipoprotein A